jgi:hypothetical protein
VGQFLADLDTLVPSGVTKKCVGTNLGAKHGNRPLGGALCGGTDGPQHRSDGLRPGAGAAPPLHTFGRSTPGVGRSAIAQRVFFYVKNPRTRLRRDPIEEKSSKRLLWVGRLPGAPLIGVELSRDCC